MEALKNLLTDFDPAAFVPGLGSVIGWIELLLRLCVLAGPIALLVRGLWYLILPPKEANHMAGYRFFWGMGSVQSWRTMQFLAGVAWTAVGAVLTIAMVIVTNGYRGMDLIAMAYSACKCLMWQIGTAAVGCLLVNMAMMVLFDFKGNIRPSFRDLFKKIPKKPTPKANKPQK